MWSRRLSDLVVLAHFAYLAFVVLGGFAVSRRPRLAWLHLPAVLWGIIVEFTGWVCPLTPLEIWLDEHGGEGAYSGGFINHYIAGLIYPSGLTRGDQIVLGSAVFALNATIYGIMLFRRRRRGRRGRSAGPADARG